MYSIRRIFNPEIYQGKYRQKNYFEGWYFKIIDKKSENIFAIIPGISISEEGKHAFIQFIDAISGKTYYKSYNANDFVYSEKEFNISIEKNHFNKFGFSIQFSSEDISVQGKINNVNIKPFPKTILNPGIMGPFSFVPFMECYHSIVNIHSDLEGTLSINGRTIDFSGGYGYLEKDWGSSFPHSWIWLQSNHFENTNATLMFSVANIPWLHTHFTGLISFLRINDSFYRFATYTRAKIKKLDFYNDVLDIEIEDPKYKLIIKATSNKGGILKAPKNGKMNINITESITSNVEVLLYNREGQLLFCDNGKNTGLELAGNFRKFILKNNLFK